MLVRESCGLLDVFGGENFAGKIRLHDILQSGDFGMIEKTAARAHVRINEARVGGILPPMRQLVAVSVENRVETKRLDGDSPC